MKNQETPDDKHHLEIQRVESEIIQILEVITAKILPANKSATTDTKTTEEFKNIIMEHFPDAHLFIETSTIYRYLVDNGYKYELICGQLVWLVKMA